MKIEIVTDEAGKKEVNGDFATVVKDTMFEKTHFGESVVGDTVQVMGFVPKGATILILVAGQEPMEGTVGTDGYICMTEHPRMQMEDNNGNRIGCKFDEVALIYAEDPENCEKEDIIVGNELFALEELSMVAQKTVQ